jgi:hypothetical protein
MLKLGARLPGKCGTVLDERRGGIRRKLSGAQLHRGAFEPVDQLIKMVCRIGHQRIVA